MSVPSVSADLALVAIARNETASIVRCLLSAKPFVDRMVVLDTGSIDNIVAIAQSCGALVSYMAWTNDFSVTCNTALQAANADWNLILDADEWLESGGKHLRMLSGAAPSVGVVCVKNDTGTTESASQLIAWIPRLLPRSVHYTGRTHEQPMSPLPTACVLVMVRHDGYTAIKMQKKGGRNTQLLLDELVHRPDDPYVLYQLGKETELHYEDYAKAVNYYVRAFSLASVDTLHRRNLALRYVYSLDKVDCIEEALAQGDIVIQTWPDFPDLCFVLGLASLDTAAKQPDEAGARWLPLAGQVFNRCLEIGDQPETDSSVIGRGSFLATQQLAIVYQMQSQAFARKFEHYLTLSKQLQDASSQ